jgi:hypothetical protein
MILLTPPYLPIPEAMKLRVWVRYREPDSSIFESGDAKFSSLQEIRLPRIKTLVCDLLSKNRSRKIEMPRPPPCDKPDFVDYSALGQFTAAQGPVF